MVRRMLFIVMLVGCKHAIAACDLSTDDGPAKAYQDLSGKALPKEHRCVKPPPPGELPVGLVGAFAYDRGCAPVAAVVKTSAGCKLVDWKDLEGAAPDVLADAGWAQADALVRAKLARQWIDLQLGWLQSPIASKPKRWDDTKPFAPPSVAGNSDGTVSAALWVQLSPGDSPGFEYRSWSIEFAKDGRPTWKRLDDSTVQVNP